MGRRRKSHKHLPQRVYVHGRQYRYHAPDGQRVPLGPLTDYAGMLRRLADLMPDPSARPLSTLAAVFDRYLVDVIAKRPAGRQREYESQIGRLRRTFGHMPPRTFRACHAAQYRDRRGAKAPTAANRELQLLSHVFTLAAEWGAVDVHPMKGIVRTIPRPPRDRYVTDAEYALMRESAAPMVGFAMDLALLTGLRRGDILALERRHLTDEGLVVKTGKTGAALLFQWSPDTPHLRAVIDAALAHPPQVRQFIICNTRGRQYTSNGFDSAWRRAVNKYKSAGGDPFQFRDLRRKSASDEPDEQTASDRLGHTSTGITRRVYRVKPKKVRPLR